MEACLEAEPSQTLGGLHPDLVRLICEHLDRSHPRSLVDFALTNKRSYNIASGLLFRTVKLTFSDGRQLAEDVSTWRALLAREGGFAHVRRLMLYCSWSRRRSLNTYLSLEACDRHDDHSEWKNCWDRCPQKFPPFSEGSIADDEWQLVAALVAQLPGLADVFYACPGQLPPCLLQALHEHVPRCRLHHYSFQLRALERDIADAHELALATSRCLYSVGGLNLANDLAVWEFVRRRAPNLRRAHIWLGNEAIEVEEMDTNDGATDRPAPLELLQVNQSNLGTSRISFDSFSAAAQGDFSALHELRLDAAIVDLSSLPAASDFPALAKVTWSCACLGSQAPYWGTLATFLHELPRLTILRLLDWNRDMSVVPALSPKLRTLDVYTRVALVGTMSPVDHIHQLADLCPLLEELGTEMDRSRGDAAEVSLYRAMGRLPRLRRLALSLHASLPKLDPTVEYLDAAGDSISHGAAIEPWFDAEDAKTMEDPEYRPYRRGHIRGLLVNAAIDARLARSIFEVIDKAKASLPGEVQPLERMEMHTIFAQAFPIRPEANVISLTATLPRYLSSLCKTWSVERDAADRAVLHVTRALERKHPAPDVGPFLDVEGLQLDVLIREVRPGEEVLKIWQRLWPATEEGGQWWKGWKSWPLCVEGED